VEKPIDALWDRTAFVVLLGGADLDVLEESELFRKGDSA
jgi:hypothetical protein